MKKMVPKKHARSGSLREDGRLYVPYRILNTELTTCDVVYNELGDVHINISDDGTTCVSHETTGWVVNMNPLLSELNVCGFKKIPMIEENGIVKFNILQ